VSQEISGEKEEVCVLIGTLRHGWVDEGTELTRVVSADTSDRHDKKRTIAEGTNTGRLKKKAAVKFTADRD